MKKEIRTEVALSKNNKLCVMTTYSSTVASPFPDDVFLLGNCLFALI